MASPSLRRSTFVVSRALGIHAVGEVGMRESGQVASWAVYQVTVLGQPGPNAVCTQGEWDEISAAQPGLHRLVRGGIANEGEAERLARGTSGDGRPRTPHKKVLTEIVDARPDV